MKPVKPKKINSVTFVKEGTSITSPKPKNTGLLHLTNDWKLRVDLIKGYTFPSHIALTDLRPDFVIYSNSLKRVIIIELTCPCEENIKDRHDEKFTKYSNLATLVKANGWIPNFFLH